MINRSVVSLACIFFVVLVLAMLAMPAQAQDPVTGALATLSAATAQAQAAQWQRAQEATRQAQNLAATSQAQAIQAEATRQAQAVEIEVTRQSHMVNVNATATAQAQANQAQATRAAIDADATRAAYDVAMGEMQARSDFGTLLLYIAGSLAIIACGSFFFWWAIQAARRAADDMQPIKPVTAAATPSGVIIDAVPMIAAPNRRMSGIVEIDDPLVLERVRDLIEHEGIGGSANGD